MPLSGEIPKLFQFFVLLLLPHLLPMVGRSDPASDWVSIYGWLQTGERLSEAEQWPLALGSFIESHRQLKRLRQNHPGFEPEMVAYRLERVENVIPEVQEKLGSGEQEIMTKFVDFIDSFESGMDLRFSNKFPEALDTLEVARVLLDEIIFERPDEFREAVDTQYNALQSSLSWLENQISFKERSNRSPVIFAGDGVDWGTTKFLKETDLPQDGEEILASAALFPGRGEAGQVLSRSPANGENPGSAEVVETGPEEVKPSLPRFRMSSQQKSAPVPFAEGDHVPEG